jgi:hypothetical protein
MAPAYEPSCSATDATSDLRKIDRHGNITTYKYSKSADGLSVQTMIDPDGRQTVVTFDVNGQGMPRLRTVETPSVGNAPPLRYSVDWRTLQFRFDQIWPDVKCTSERGYAEPCGFPMVMDVVERILLPDGRRYAFEYGPWGNLTRLTEPGGAVREYIYGDATNLTFAKAAVPLLNRIESSAMCGAMWSGEAVKMQARGLTRDRLYPDGLAGPSHDRTYNFVHRKLAVPGCTYDTIGAATAGPDACSQVWMESIEPDGSVTKNGAVARAVPPANALPTPDDRFSIPPNVPVSYHGVSFAQEQWSGPNLITANYNGDKDTGQLWYESEFVKLVVASTAVPVNLRTTKARSFSDGLFTTTNFVYGHAVDIDPGNGVERRATALTSTCKFAGIVNETACSGPTSPLIRTEMRYANQFETFGVGNILNLMTSERVYGPTSVDPLTEKTLQYDEFPLAPSGRPSNALDAGHAGVPHGNVTTITHRVNAVKSISSQSRYYDTGDLLSTTDPLARVTTYTPEFTLCTSTTPRRTIKQTNALGHVTSSTIDCNSGLTLQSVDANGKSTYLQYDFLARPVESAGPGDELTALPTTGAQPFTRAPGAPTGAGTRPGEAKVSTWTEYLSLGTLGQHRIVNHVRDGSPDGHYTKTFADGRGRTIQTRSEVDAATTGFNEVVSTHVYDGMDRVVKKFVPCFATRATALRHTAVRRRPRLNMILPVAPREQSSPATSSRPLRDPRRTVVGSRPPSIGADSQPTHSRISWVRSSRSIVSRLPAAVTVASGSRSMRSAGC